MIPTSDCDTMCVQTSERSWHTIDIIAPIEETVKILLQFVFIHSMSFPLPMF